MPLNLVTWSPFVPVVPRAFVAIVIILAVTAVASGDDQPQSKPVEANDATIRGVLQCEDGRPVPFARVQWGRRARKPGHTDATDLDGIFVLTDLPHRSVNLRVHLYGVPRPERKPDLRKWVEAGDQGAVLVVDLGKQLVIRAEGIRFKPDRWHDPGVTVINVGARKPPPITDARLYVEVGGEVLSWVPVVEDGALRFRRIETGRPWTLYIPWTRFLQGTCFLSGPQLEGGDRTVALEPGRRITGTVAGAENTRIPEVWTGPSYKGLVARRGPVSLGMRAPFPWGGSAFTFPPLPSGCWEVSVYNVETDRGLVGATVQVAAGDKVLLRPVPSEEAYDRARWGEP